MGMTQVNVVRGSVSLALLWFAVGVAARLPVTSSPALAVAFGEGLAEDGATDPRQPASGGSGLTLSVRVVSGESEPWELCATFENNGNQDIFLNLGMLLANGKVQLPTALRIILTGPNGNAHDLEFRDPEHPFVGGRVDDYAVPLRVGSAHSLRLRSKHYWCPKNPEGLALPPGDCTLQLVFSGRSAQHVNLDTEGMRHMPYWVGELRAQGVVVSPTQK
ncbi:MAG: hypothetical protein AB7O52_03395 [Planctomycetota bacterium]